MVTRECETIPPASRRTESGLAARTNIIARRPAQDAVEMKTVPATVDCRNTTRKFQCAEAYAAKLVLCDTVIPFRDRSRGSCSFLSVAGVLRCGGLPLRGGLSPHSHLLHSLISLCVCVCKVSVCD